ncbi:ABC transporter type 1, transmembrane domain-containing protein [Russula dissimulans]|nr:ABC transporter type 1, transmembrane domain-containing protein [Russula dissimulans]
MEQCQHNWAIVRRLAVHIWLKSDWGTRGRVVLGVGLLIGGKLLNVQVPFFFKQIIDGLNVPFDPQSASTVWVICSSIILAYGAARIGATLFSESLNAVFANVGQRAVHTIAHQMFEHLLNLDLKFHLSRQTSGLTRAIDRGTKGVTFILQAILFRIVPTALEISLVCFGIFDFPVLKFYPYHVSDGLTRTQFRRQANAADNKAATVAVDSPLNYEAVKDCNNGQYEIQQYDTHLCSYEKASIKIATSLTLLNSGQNVIYSSALTGIMFLAAQGVINGQLRMYPHDSCFSYQVEHSPTINIDQPQVQALCPMPYQRDGLLIKDEDEAFY